MNYVNKIVYLGLFLLPLSGCESRSTTEPMDKQLSETNPPKRLFLQQITSSSAIVKWRSGGDIACYTERKNLKDFRDCVPATVENPPNGITHKIALLSGLKADTPYYYTVNGVGSKEQQFRTAPETGTLPSDGNTHIWIIGDSGTATAILPEVLGGNGELLHVGEAAEVRDGFLSYNAAHGNESVDLFLQLGDNDYMDGSDKQWQGAFFDIYPNIMNKTAVWPTIGNHEMGAAFVPLYGGVHGGGVSTASDHGSYDDLDDSTLDQGMPYLDIFSLPARGEAGGVPSGTEQYYSFDYANVHIVSLDSQLSARDEVLRKSMRDWLIMDLSANTQDWTIVIFHHPPYSKGGHDSDTAPSSLLGIDQPIIDMRVEFTPLFEAHGVDLVYSGHSHAYERSWYLHGHRGDANTFVAAEHAELNNDGFPASGRGEEVYRQITQSGEDDRVVYTVAGSSGMADLGEGKLDHPAHFKFPDGRHGLELKGSVVLDISRTELKANFIDEAGAVQDQFSITR